MTTSRRVLRSTVLTRLRAARIGRRAVDFVEQTSMILKVAADVADLVHDARDKLEAARTDQAIRSCDMQAALHEFRKSRSDNINTHLGDTRRGRAERSRDMHGALDAFASAQANETEDMPSTARAQRAR